MADRVAGADANAPDSPTEPDEAAPQENDDPVDPVEVDEPETTDPGAPWARMPAWVTGVVTLASLAGFAYVIGKGWDFVVTSDEAAEQADWEQLLGLIDRVDSLVLFILGAVFGVAVQSRQTADAKLAANKNKTEAEKQHVKAKKNQERAQRNKRSAMTKAHEATENRKLARGAVSKLRQAMEAVEQVERDPAIAFVEGQPIEEDPHLAHSVRRLIAGAPRSPVRVEVTDRLSGLDDLAVELRSYVEDVERRLE